MLARMKFNVFGILLLPMAAKKFGNHKEVSCSNCYYCPCQLKTLISRLPRGFGNTLLLLIAVKNEGRQTGLPKEIEIVTAYSS